MKKIFQLVAMLFAATMVACGPEVEPPTPEPPADSYGLMGDFQDNNWTTDIPLVKDGDYLVAQDVVFANANNEGLAFKVRKNASWDTAYGADGSTFELNSEIALTGGSNVFINGEVGVKYDFYFTVEPMKIWVMLDGDKPGDPLPVPDTYGLMGDFQDNNWTTDIPLVKDGDYLVAQDVVFANANNEGLAFKVRKNASWDVSYGADGSTFDLHSEIALTGGSNVFINGEVGVKYDFYFTVEPMKIWVMTDGAKPGDALPEPEPGMVEVTAVVVFCNYYGDDFGGPGYNYYLTLSDVGFDENGYVMSNSKNYALDLYADTPAADGDYSLPLGTYTFDELDTMEPGTMGTYGYALMCGAAEDGSEDEEHLYTAGTVVISENKIEATLTLDNGEVHHIVYEGSLVIPGGGEYEGWSMLPGDLDVTSAGGYYAIEPYGDYYEVGADNYFIYIYQGMNMETGAPTGVFFNLDILASGLNTTDCLGTYTPFVGESFFNTFIPGSLYEDAGEVFPVGCIAMDMESQGVGPVFDGTIKIEAGEAGKLNFTFDCVDDCGNAIAGVIEAVDMYGTASMVAPAKAAQKPAPAVRGKLFNKRNMQKIAR